jgi:7,8-dihydropterin-6-yl-methyl-4-(beta-D-ribofuranosyl)aminobenzene 5'-phosphate synthase
MEDNTTRITVLVDDKARMGLTKEHEFYAWIKVSGHRILFDTGQGIALMPNAAMLGCGLQLAETLVLSRGHYDHTGAVAQVLKRNPAIKVSCHPDILLSRYSIRDIAMPKDISMNAVNKSAILNLPTEQACWVTHPSED